MSNPFNYGNPVSPDQMAGRWDQIEAVARDLVNLGGHSHMIVGGRRFGKSSFLKALQYFLVKQIDQAKPEAWYFVPIVIDLQGLIKHSPEGVFGFILNTLHRHFDPLYDQRVLGTHFHIGLAKTKLHAFVQDRQKECPLDEFSEITDDLLSVFVNAYGSLRFIFLMDEVEIALDKSWTEILFNQLRSLIYDGWLRDYIRYVIVGSSQVIDVRENGSPLLNMLNVSYLQTLSEQDVLRIINLADDVPAEVARAVLEHCGGHPFIAQYFMYNLWEYGISNTTPSVVAKLANQFISLRNADLQKWRSDIGEGGRLAYKVLVEADRWLEVEEVRQRVNVPDLDIKNCLDKLCYHGLAVRDDKWLSYRTIGELFRNWFKSSIVSSYSTSTTSAKLKSNSEVKTLGRDDLNTLESEIAFISYERSGIPEALSKSLHTTLIECGPFDSNEQLRAVFTNELLIPWRNRLHEEKSREDRVDAIISLLLDQKHAEIQSSALAVFLRVLMDRVDPNDACHQRLADLAADLDAALRVGSSPRPNPF